MLFHLEQSMNSSTTLWTITTITSNLDIPLKDDDQRPIDLIHIAKYMKPEYFYRSTKRPYILGLKYRYGGGKEQIIRGTMNAENMDTTGLRRTLIITIIAADDNQKNKKYTFCLCNQPISGFRHLSIRIIGGSDSAKILCICRYLFEAISDACQYKINIRLKKCNPRLTYDNLWLDVNGKTIGEKRDGRYLLYADEGRDKDLILQEIDPVSLKNNLMGLKENCNSVLIDSIDQHQIILSNEVPFRDLNRNRLIKFYFTGNAEQVCILYLPIPEKLAYHGIQFVSGLCRTPHTIIDHLRCDDAQFTFHSSKTEDEEITFTPHIDQRFRKSIDRLESFYHTKYIILQSNMNLLSASYEIDASNINTYIQEQIKENNYYISPILGIIIPFYLDDRKVINLSEMHKCHARSECTCTKMTVKLLYTGLVQITGCPHLDFAYKALDILFKRRHQPITLDE